MKKSLVLAMAIAMGISASAFAANPFSDVPAGHWAYASIAKLAAAGVVDGYGDGTYRGDRLMTRYEMAQIVAKAMAKGANVDRLASEFADELDSLGVRVAKLEKKSDNVKITGYARYHYKDVSTTLNDEDGHEYDSKLRTRLWFTGEVNDNWNYVSMLQNDTLLDGTGDNKSTLTAEGTSFQRAYLEGRLGGAKVTAGRYNQTTVDGNLYDHRMDGIKASYGKKVNLTAYYGRPTNEDAFNYNKVWGVSAAAKMGGFDLTAGYDKFFSAGDNMNDAKAKTNLDYASLAGLNNDGVWNVGAKYDFNGKASLGVIYMKSNIDSDSVDFGDADKKGWVVTGTVAGAKASKPGSWGLWAKYYNQGLGTVVAHTMNGAYFDTGFKGWGAGVDYTLAKNMVAGFQYFDLSAKNTSDDNSAKTLWSQLIVTF
jgi:hypothetical protein